MDAFDVAFLKAIISIVLFAGTGLIGLRLWLGARPRRLPDLDRVVDALREENAELQAALAARMNELEERVDFVERRLVQPPVASRLPQPERTPV